MSLSYSTANSTAPIAQGFASPDTLTFTEVSVDLLDDLNLGAVDVASLATDFWALYLIKQKLGFTGTVTGKIWKGKLYVIVAGTRNTPSALQGTRYLASNPTVVQIAQTAKSFGAQVKGVFKGNVYTLILFGGIDMYRSFENETSATAHVLGSSISLIVKAAIGALALVAVTAIATFATLATLPATILAISAVIIVGSAVNYFDDRYDLTDKLILMLEAEKEKLTTKMVQSEPVKQYRAWENYLQSAAINGRLGTVLHQLFH